jgi:hypothetical protein
METAGQALPPPLGARKRWAPTRRLDKQADANGALPELGGSWSSGDGEEAGSSSGAAILG